MPLSVLSGARVSSHAVGQVELDLFDAAGLVGAGLHPVDVGQRHADLVLQPAAHIDRGGLRPFRHADALAAAGPAAV